MTTQLLIYERAVPISKQRHNDWSVKTGRNYDFARHVNSVPLVAAEFQAAAAEYAIVFAGTEKAVMPSVILGVRERENLYVSDDGVWG
ncbi:MAG: SapC family protein, partial [Gammaproteobacteria bacterium]|nr:SapC family protein [Gammaproteobacteria bacterium]NNJ83830.1 multidrug transporter [Gammaproteobacteria bacterium]